MATPDVSSTTSSWRPGRIPNGSGSPSKARDASGWTESADFPTANPLRPQALGGGEAFVAKLSPDGSGLIYSTYLGGSAYDAGYSIAVDADGDAYVAGTTGSTDFPTVNALQPAFG